MVARIYEWDKNETGWNGIEVTDNKVINLILRSLNNLIKVNANNEVYTDLQLDDNLLSTATLPVWVTTGRVIQANGRPVTWTLLSIKTTSGDQVTRVYGDNGVIYIDNGSGTWKEFYQKHEVDDLIQDLEDSISDVGFSGNYDDLTGTPWLCTLVITAEDMADRTTWVFKDGALISATWNNQQAYQINTSITVEANTINLIPAVNAVVNGFTGIYNGWNIYIIKTR